MLLRLGPNNTYVIPLPSNIRDSIDILRALLQRGKFTNKISQACYNVLSLLWTQEWEKSKENSIGDPMICSLALAMLKHDGSFNLPVHTTPYIARLQYCLRLVFLLTIDSMSKFPDTSPTMECNKYSKWFTEKNVSTFNTLASLQHLAFSFVRGQISMPRIMWTDREHYQTLRYLGSIIEFPKLHDVFEQMENDAIHLWETQILMGCNLSVKTKNICDDLTNSSVGYSFLTDPRNTQFHLRDQLFSQVLSNADLRKRFLTCQSDSDGHPIWNTQALQLWLFNYSKFEGLLLASIEMKAGSPGRGTEITCLEYQNTRTRMRGLYMMGGHLAVLRQYHKSASISGVDKVIPHSVDAVTADLIIQNLAIARPFAEIAAFICYPTNRDVQGRYNSCLFVNNKELFTTAGLTNLMKTLTRKHLSVGLGVNDWRHVSTAFRRKICPGLDELADQDEDNTVEALQSGHSRDTENRIYGISTDRLSGPGEDVLPLFLDVSTDWQVANRITPGGYCLSYRDAIARKYPRLVQEKIVKSDFIRPHGHMQDVVDKIAHIVQDKMDAQVGKVVDALIPKLQQILADALKPGGAKPIGKL